LIAGTFTDGPFASAGSDRLNNLLAWCLGAVMPWFLDQLAKDYGDWAAGKPRWGGYKLNPVYHSLKSAWFQPLSIYHK
jgi:hypothetical protein